MHYIDFSGLDGEATAYLSLSFYKNNETQTTNQLKNNFLLKLFYLPWTRVNGASPQEIVAPDYFEGRHCWLNFEGTVYGKPLIVLSNVSRSGKKRQKYMEDQSKDHFLADCYLKYLKSKIIILKICTIDKKIILHS